MKVLLLFLKVEIGAHLKQKFASPLLHSVVVVLLHRKLSSIQFQYGLNDFK